MVLSWVALSLASSLSLAIHHCRYVHNKPDYFRTTFLLVRALFFCRDQIELLQRHIYVVLHTANKREETFILREEQTVGIVLQMGPKAEDVKGPWNPISFAYRFVIGVLAASYFVLVPIYMWLKDLVVPKGQPI